MSKFTEVWPWSSGGQPYSLYPGNQFWRQIYQSLFLGSRPLSWRIILETFHKIIFIEVVLGGGRGI